MATITVAAATAGVAQAHTIQGDVLGSMQIAEITFELSGTYDRSATESVEITGIATCIQNSRRNGKTVTLKGAMPGHSTFDTSGVEHRWMTAILNSTTVDATLYDCGTAAEQADEALPTFVQPMSVYVSFIES
jgi:hypothetical protein